MVYYTYSGLCTHLPEAAEELEPLVWIVRVLVGVVHNHTVVLRSLGLIGRCHIERVG
jgi:hypothetical protein